MDVRLQAQSFTSVDDQMRWCMRVTFTVPDCPDYAGCRILVKPSGTDRYIEVADVPASDAMPQFTLCCPGGVKVHRQASCRTDIFPVHPDGEAHTVYLVSYGIDGRSNPTETQPSKHVEVAGIRRTFDRGILVESS